CARRDSNYYHHFEFW
nr:immunoglobulin heavy chain junction region [Macaca mulatta]MOV38145.1 immunoglobulin heavy chain junction region [Macaca mulatta]MOV39123.1 immunoglobulin heavy chain junction region [Macaca mulatta]MOV40711.1 immunoglobulin heavy chain junction region [Macaca mulatta]MOV41068.1 immunoglobulin heavy chain junction region [Macaca mulatta]